MHDPNCMYCEENQTLRDLMLYLCDIGPYKAYFFKNQCYPGRCIVAYKDHVRLMTDLSEADCAEYWTAVQKLGKAIAAVYNPAQINYATFGDKAGHIHCHLVPKYEGGLDFGTTFGMNPEPPVLLGDEETARQMEKLRAAL